METPNHSFHTLSPAELSYVNGRLKKNALIHRLVMAGSWAITLAMTPILVYIGVYEPGGSTGGSIIIALCCLCLLTIAIVMTVSSRWLPIRITEGAKLRITGTYRPYYHRIRHCFIEPYPYRFSMPESWHNDYLEGETVTAEIFPLPLLTWKSIKDPGNPTVEYIALSFRDHSVIKG